VARWGKFITMRKWAILAAAAAALLATAAPADAGRAVRAKPAQATKVQAGQKHRAAARPTALRAKPGTRVAAAGGKRTRTVLRRVAFVPAQPSVGQASGLHAGVDPLALRSSVALVVDQDTDQVLFSKNPGAVLPIASLTKLMTALVVVEAGLPLDEPVSIGQADLDLTVNNRSRLALGTTLPRGEMLRLALMSSENRAASALARHYPGGAEAFVAAMNGKAMQLGMRDTRYVEPTGLSSDNRSSAMDLTQLVKAAAEHQLIRELSTSHDAQVAVGDRQVQFRNTNILVGNPTWDIGLQKTGYIAAAGRCLVMQAQMAGRKLIMVFLDSAGKYSRIGDAERIRQWLAQTPVLAAGLPLAGPLRSLAH